MLKTCTYRKHLMAFCCTLLSFIISTAQNPIVTENAIDGNPASEWDISGAGDLSIQGFATDISVNKGGTIHFKIKTDASAYTIKVYRIGYYNGKGARYMGDGTVSATLPQVQPEPLEDAATGLVDCGNWSESGHWNVPASAVSGAYIARLQRTDNNGASHIIFIVRDDASTSDLLFQTSDATWQAYNVYGGNSLYVGTTSFPGGHAAKVSYNRPFVTRSGGGGGGAMEDWLFNAEYPMIRFLERNGYNVTYTTNVDVARSGNLIANHKVFLSVGHDEYWSAEQRTNVQNALQSGTHLAFFSGNELYWKTRWENSTDVSNTPYRTLVCYKEGTVGEKTCGTKCDPSPVWTGLWKEGCAYPAGGACQPENALTGQASWVGSTSAIRVPAQYKNLRFWRNTSITSLTSESEATLPNGTLGYEWDFEQLPDYNPGGRITMSSTTVGGKTHKLSLYRHQSGALVFGSGTVQWSWGLDSVHDRGNLSPDKDMQQATVNLLADMEVQPATLQSDLLPATLSTDLTAPSVTITSPAHGADLVSGMQTTISGTASEAGGGVLVGIEVSVDGGLTWKPAQGTTNWNYPWTPSTLGTVTIKVRGFDDSGNIGIAGTAPSSDAISLEIVNATCPCSVFQPTETPSQLNVYDNVQGANLGMKFKSALDGYITGIRFYKSTNDTGPHTGTLWTLTGSVLVQVTFLDETTSGWQQVLLPTAIPVTAGTTYVVSYHSPSGYYSQTPFFFNTSRVNSPLTALAETDPNGPNGVFSYGASPIFPTDGYQATNYWVDVVFDTTIAPDVTAPLVSSSIPYNNATQVNVTADIQVNFNEFIDPASITTATFELRDAANAIVPATLSGIQNHAILNPVSSLNYSSPYTATIKGGPDGVTDLAGNPLDNDIIWTFSTADPAPLPPTEGPGGPILVVTSAANQFSTFSAEILRAEGLMEFTVADISTVNASMLTTYDVVIIGDIAVSAAEASMFDTWVNAGGTLIAFKPSASLSTLLGITPAAGTLAEGYLLVNTTAGTPGAGIVGQTMQYHGSADLYTLSGATAVATLYSNATTATTNPAVTLRSVGSNGGKAIAFTYDLNRSIVYTRQGNPAWAGQKRDGTIGPIRSDDLFFGGTDPDWVDFNKIAIPQADEQQRLLVNLVLLGNMHRKPLPRFWFLPSKHKAAIVMTGDDHNLNGTVPLFNHFTTLGPNSPQDILDWKAIRATSYIYPTTMTNAQAMALEAQGFEIALHVNTGCADFTPASLENNILSQLNSWVNLLPGVPLPTTNRNHCIAWSDWATMAKLSDQYDIRLDANYYYWPETWVNDRPGMFTGSGMPMRFADLDGTMIDCYQLTTQMPDESGLEYTSFTNALLDKAQGPEGYYGVFCANMHTDSAVHTGANAIIASAIAHNVPVISAKQLLTWLDGRNSSSFSSINMVGDTLKFNITAMSAAYNMMAMVPFTCDSGQLIILRRNGSAVAFTRETIKGIEYAFFAGATGIYEAVYGEATTGILNGIVELQGRPAAPDPSYVSSVKVDLYEPGNTTTPIHTYNVTTDQTGHFTIIDIPVGTYTIAVKGSHTLARVRASETIAIGGNSINFGVLLEGDASDDNAVDLLDFGALLLSYNLMTGDAGFDARADFNNDGIVDLLDFGMLLVNYNQFGETP
jgi:hypothetical protein